MNLKNKRILIGVCGGIAAYKALEIISVLKKSGAEIKVIMTKSAAEFVTPLSFMTMSKNKVALDMFEMPENYDVKHITLANWAELILIIPATANIIGKIASGIADDMLSTVIMASKAKKVIAPAMNTAMYENKIVQKNIEFLKTMPDYLFAEPINGMLACGVEGNGHLADVNDIVEIVRAELTCKKDLKGKKILVTAGATIEEIDPVRYITNHSSGKMGYEIARAAKYRGAEVVLVSGKTALTPVTGIKTVYVKSAEDMYNAVLEHFDSCDAVIKAAAVGDYRPKCKAENKIKKENDLTLELIKNKDILKELGKIKTNQKLIGFCMETENLIENAAKKLKEKNLDMIAANNLFDANAGFGTNNNTITILTDKIERLPNMSKFDAANKILDRMLKL